MLHYIQLGYSLHYTPAAGIDCSQLVDHTVGIGHSPEQLGRCNSSGIETDHNLRTAKSSGQAGRIVLRAGMNLRPVGRFLPVVVDCCSDLFAEFAVRGSLPVRQGHLPKS